MIQQLRQDVRYALRTFVRAPGFAAVVVGTIAVGIGANAAIFSVVNAVLLRPLPYPRAGELVILSQGNRVTKQSGGDATPANFLDWRQRNRSFIGLAAFLEGNPTVTSGDSPERIHAAQVNANFFDLLEVKPALGRGFLSTDEGPGAPRVVVVSDRFWRERLGARSDVLGQSLKINDELHTIVGVIPRGLDFPAKSELWMPPHWRVPDDPLLSPVEDPSSQRGHGYFSVLGRLKADVTLEHAMTDMDTVALGLERDFPGDNENLGSFLVPLRDDLVADLRTTTILLLAAVGLLLLIAVANVSGLLMARASTRQQEISVRVALGATRRRIVAQLLTESVLLALAGGAAGVLLAMWLVNPLVALSPSDLTVAGDVRVDGRVLLFCAVTATVVGILFGLAPARQLSRADVHEDLKQATRGAVGTRQQRLRATLVAGEIALSLVLLVTAGLTVRSFIKVQQVTTGFSPESVVTVTVSPPQNRYRTQPLRADFWERTLASLGRVPGVERVGAISRLPLLPGNSTRGIEVTNLPPDVPASAHYRTTTPDYFKVMSIPLLQGRAFEAGDRENRPRVAIASAAAAQRFWRGREAVGEHFRIDVPGPEYTIVGVVGDVRSASLDSPPPPTIYVPYRQDAFPFMTFVLKTSASPAALTAGVRAGILEVDKDLPVGALRTMDEQLSNSLTRRRFSVTLLVAFGLTAVALAAIGLYGVLAFIVSQRRREIGVRIALGATARDVVVDVLGQGLRLAAVGIAVGVGLSLGASRLLTSMLFGTSPSDVGTYAGSAAVLTLIAATASFVPAFRASRVDPIIALRDE
jgi:putative ABC transport system permease protein